MKAIAKTKREKGVEIIDVDKPKIENSEDVIIRVNTASICGSDVHIYDWNDWAAARIEPVRIIGHEFSGEVVETGSDVSTVVREITYQLKHIQVAENVTIVKIT